MAFRFSLETVLRVRKIAEDREERLLGEILQQMAQCRRSLADLASRRTSLLLERQRALEARTPAGELLFWSAQIQVVDSLQQSGRQHLADLEKLRAQQLSVYAEAHKNRKLLATMREEQLDRFRAEQVRAEQKQMDDRFSAMQARNTQSAPPFQF